MKSVSQNNSNLVDLLLFEVLERIAIFNIHLKETDSRFFPARSPKSSEKHFVDSFNECLFKLLQCAIIIVESEESNFEQYQEKLRQLREIILQIRDLHQSHLGHLPRTPEPPELKRFGRILHHHAVELKTPESDITVYLGEEASESTYAGDPLLTYKLNNLNKIIQSTNSLPGNNKRSKIELFAAPPSENLGYHLTVPRIDATNPCRWPTLVHEVGHRIMDKSFFKHGDIKTDFEEYITNNKIKLPDNPGPNFELKHWLTECWCDLFGAVVIGPSFWFSQWSSFLFNADESVFKGAASHPPILFRLHLIYKVLNHRFPSALSSTFKRTASEARKLLEEFDSSYTEGFMRSHFARNLVLQFQDYFVHHFFTMGKDGELVLGENALNSHLASLIKYTKSIEEKVIDSMVKDLSSGLPIPSVPFSDSPIWRERAATVQEILLSAWIYRNTNLHDDVLKKYKEIIDKNASDTNKIWDEYVDEIVKLYNSFNFSVLRSVQVSEWFHLFEDTQQGLSDEIIEKAGRLEEADSHPSMLVDYQIFNLIRSKEIKAIPIINLEKQLGSTSLDVRLGTSFQVYSPNQVGVLDITNKESIENANTNSTLIDLDYLKYITLAPGQFMLGHTMEYICLPLTISAQLEGRSSFARLGIEVHMTASFIDPGFEGVLTFEIFNAGPNPVRLFPGIRIGQLRFFWGSSPGKPYNRNPAAKYKGLLQHRNSLQFADYEINLLSKEIERKKCP